MKKKRKNNRKKKLRKRNQELKTKCAAAAFAIAKVRRIDHSHAAVASQSSVVSLPLVFWLSLSPLLYSLKFSTACWTNISTGGTYQLLFYASAHLLSELFSSSDSSPRIKKEPELECGLLWCLLSSHSLSLLSGISATSNGSTSMTSSLPELMLLDTPCKPRKPSWYGAYSSELSLISPGPISFALLLPMLLLSMESKSQLTGLVELVVTCPAWIWVAWWVAIRKMRKLPPTRNEHHRCDSIHTCVCIQCLQESMVLGTLYIDIFRIYFRSQLLEL